MSYNTVLGLVCFFGFGWGLGRRGTLHTGALPVLYASHRRMCAGTGPTCAQDHLGFRVKGFGDHVVTWSPFDALLMVRRGVYGV